MRRPASAENDDEDDEKDKVTVKSMIISMVRVRIFYFLLFNCKHFLLTKKMPPRLWKLMICQVIGWIGYFATHLYFTDFMATV
jgi:hypothetical protein